MSYSNNILNIRYIIQGGAKVITLLENAIIFANGAKWQFGFDICEVKKRRILMGKKLIG